MSTPVDPTIAAKISLTSSNDRIAFQRRVTNLERFIIDNVHPIEQQIMLLREQLIPMYDRVAELRAEAESLCTHAPEELRLTEDGAVECQYCREKFHV